jgi:thiamine pyrophosphokinase
MGVENLEAVVVLAAGDPLPPWIAGELPEAIFVIAADGGLDHAQPLGLEVDLLIGDLDSIGKVEGSFQVVAHPPDKDQTDLELALEAAAALDPPEIIVVGGTGGRLDHLLANAALLAAPKLADHEVTWLTGSARVQVVRTATEIHGSRHDLVSLLPYGGPVSGITTRGLRWPLRDETLEPGSSRGVSNQMTGPVARVQIGEGTLLAIHSPADLA